MRVIPALIAFASPLALFAPVEPVAAQANEDLAKAYFIKASQSFEQGKYKEALESLTTAEQRIGGTNARISALKVKIHMKRGNKREAAKALEAFYRHDSSETLQAEMADYLVELDQFKQEYAALDPYAMGQSYFDRVNENKASLVSSRVRKSMRGALENGIVLWRETFDDIRIRRADSPRDDKLRVEFSYSATWNSVDRMGNRRRPRYSTRSYEFDLSQLSLRSRGGMIAIDADSLLRDTSSPSHVRHEYSYENAALRSFNNEIRRWLTGHATFSQTVSLTEKEKLAREKNADQFAAGIASRFASMK